MADQDELERKISNDSDAISLFYDGESLLSYGSKKRSVNSLSSIDEYLGEPKRFCADGNISYDWNDSLRKQPTDERINTLFGRLENAPLETVPEYIPDLCNDLVKHGRTEGLQHLLELVNDSPIAGRDAVYDYMLQALLDEEHSYSKALKQLVKIIYALGKPSEKCIGYIVRKIFNADNDDIGAFLDELKQIYSTNAYKFNATMINKMMNHCITHFNLPFHHFVSQIVNKLSESELDLVNEDILKKFTDRRMTHVRQQRMGLSRKF